MCKTRDRIKMIFDFEFFSRFVYTICINYYMGNNPILFDNLVLIRT